MRMRDAVAETWPLAADVTGGSHGRHSKIRMTYRETARSAGRPLEGIRPAASRANREAGQQETRRRRKTAAHPGSPRSASVPLTKSLCVCPVPLDAWPRSRSPT
jgi:hypothetical protein